MKSFLPGIVLGVAGLATARQCQNITIPVSISAVQPYFDIKTPTTNIDVTNFMLNLTQAGSNFSATIQKGTTRVSGTYKIAATLCNPEFGQSRVLQLLTHGIGFDRSYWDAPLNNYNYSYVNIAVDRYGYSTFTWDRLGIGMSQHGEPVNEIQAQLEIEALHALTNLLREGRIDSCEKPFKKIVHVGHSFGSQHTYALTQKYPSSSQGITLTGFSQNGTYVPYFALGGNLVQANSNPAFQSYVSGYFASADQSAAQTNFFAPNSFAASTLDYAAKTGQPVTVGELLTTGTETMSINNFPGPALVITGERDLPFCGGNCYATPPPGYASIPAVVQKTLPKVSNFKAVVVPGAGHGLNFEFSHPFTYQAINEYFVSQGLGPW